MLEFGVTDDEAWQVGLACGGQIQILVEPVE
jgi:xanthine/CO dehydrogenase XdhC/CoxF family maturation factor